MNDKAFSYIANLARNNDIIMIRILDPLEISLPESGTWKLTDGEKEMQVHTYSNKARNEYHQRYLDEQQQMEKFCRQYRIHLINISTQENAAEKLKAGLGVRGKGNKAQFRSAQSTR
jgi:hypothetical protein